MKQFLLLTAICIAIATSAQSDKYESAMKKNLALFDSAKKIEDYQAIAAAFARIGDAEKTQWLPYYYAGLALSSAGWRDSAGKLDKDENANSINNYCSKAEALTTNDSDKSEIYALRNMSATQQMMVDPQSRFMQYGMAAHEYLEKRNEVKCF